MREELFWDRNGDQAPAEIVIQRAINFGGFDFIKEVQEKYGMEKFVLDVFSCKRLPCISGAIVIIVIQYLILICSGAVEEDPHFIVLFNRVHPRGHEVYHHLSCGPVQTHPRQHGHKARDCDGGYYGEDRDNYHHFNQGEPWFSFPLDSKYSHTQPMGQFRKLRGFQKGL